MSARRRHYKFAKKERDRIMCLISGYTDPPQRRIGKFLPLYDHGTLLPFPFGACECERQLVFGQEDFIYHAGNGPNWGDRFHHG